MLYIYISSYLNYIDQLPSLNIVLFIFGISAILSIVFNGTQIDRRLRVMTLMSLGRFAIAALILAVSFHSITTVYISTVLWGLTFGGAPTLLQTALADADDVQVDVAFSFFVTLFNLAVAGGGRIGDTILDWSNAGGLL